MKMGFYGYDDIPNDEFLYLDKAFTPKIGSKYIVTNTKQLFSITPIK